MSCSMALPATTSLPCRGFKAASDNLRRTLPERTCARTASEILAAETLHMSCTSDEPMASATASSSTSQSSLLFNSCSVETCCSHTEMRCFSTAPVRHCTHSSRSSRLLANSSSSKHLSPDAACLPPSRITSRHSSNGTTRLPVTWSSPLGGRPACAWRRDFQYFSTCPSNFKKRYLQSPRWWLFLRNHPWINVLSDSSIVETRPHIEAAVFELGAL
mmetsp:Transcript_57892/g.109002  ORF Transcript_57892/g.109002 Transcript_57892/m.109002 type:complete len:217 (+) Transcript_57892:722-1372(+)